MTILVRECPHCLTERMSLDVVAERVLEGELIRCVYFFCPKCGMPSCGRVFPEEPSVRFSLHNANDGRDISNLKWRVIEFWPELPEPKIPRGLPASVERAYRAAEGNFSGMYRRALDIGIGAFDANVTGSLKQRIDKLAGTHKIAPDIADWAHGVRLGGNDAMHDPEEITRPELIALRGLSEMVLTYLFQMPAMLEARKMEATK